MPKKSADQWKPDTRGRFRRKVGVIRSEDGVLQPYKFSFGKDKERAIARLARVRELWSYVEADFQNRQQPELPSEFDLNPNYSNPQWEYASLSIAKALARGAVSYTIGSGDDPNGHAWTLHDLARRYPCVHFVSEDEEHLKKGETFLRLVGEHQMKQVVSLAPNVLIADSGSLHEAFERYSEYAKTRYVEPTNEGETLTSFGAQVVSVVKSLRSRHIDVPTASLDIDGCQALIDYWRNRPLTVDKRIPTPRPMAKKTCENHISELVRFFKWLHRSKQYEWRKPDDFDELALTVKDLPQERTSVARRTGREFYLIHELVKLNRYATPLERLLLLLGLNCGFKGAEQGTLEPCHIFLDEGHPNSDYIEQATSFQIGNDDGFVIYRRNKTKIVGEFLLWSQTKEVLRWAIERRDVIAAEHGVVHPNILLTKDGKLFHRLTEGQKNRSQIFNNKWTALIKRVRKDDPDFPRFPFSTLRDSASDLIRQAADGETAAVFLMHGTPVEQDDLLDLYTQRPFTKVFAALRAVEQKLKPMFDAVDGSPVEQPQQQYTSLRNRKAIVQMTHEGLSVSDVATKVGVSEMTVRRTLAASKDKSA